MSGIKHQKLLDILYKERKGYLDEKNVRDRTECLVPRVLTPNFPPNLPISNLSTSSYKQSHNPHLSYPSTPYLDLKYDSLLQFLSVLD